MLRGFLAGAVELAKKTREQAVALGSFSNYTWNSTVDPPTLTWFAPCHLIIFTMYHSFLGDTILPTNIDPANWGIKTALLLK